MRQIFLFTIINLLIGSLCFGTTTSKMEGLFSSTPFAAESGGLAVNDFAIVIEKSALEKNFLLTAAIIDGPPVGLGRSLQSKVVFFKKQGDSLYLFQSTDGLLVSTSVVTHKLLIAFPILAEDTSKITFDFKNGMNRILMASEMHASDFEGRNRANDKPLTVTTSFLNKVEIRNDILYINQLVQVKDNGTETAKEMKYSLRIYQPKKDFPVKESSYMKKVGFFEVSPVYEADGRPRTNIMKFDISKPVTYHIARSVPADYQQAVKDGILYWNRAFGKEVLKVAQLPADVTPHQPGYNIVQWLDYDSAGFAYADMQADPFTGEILQSHVYMTSVFAVKSKIRARELLIKLASVEKSDNKRHPVTFLEGFSLADVCRKEVRRQYVNFLYHLVNNSEIGDDIIKRFSQDYVRTIIAHEVGHTLGLRHNFAGSLSSNIKTDEYGIILNQYLANGTVAEDKVTTSTVMDYMVTTDEALQGAAIRNKAAAFEYDRLALTWGYSDKRVDEINFPPFCTDSKNGKYIDCVTWDSFAHPIKSRAFALEENIKFIPANLALNFFRAKVANNARDRIKVNQVKLDPAKDAKGIASLYTQLKKTLAADAKFLTVARKFPFISSLNIDAFKRKTKDFQANALSDMGGLTTTLFDYFIKDETLLPFTKGLNSKYQHVINSPAFQIFSSEELAYMSKIGEQYFSTFTKELLGHSLIALADNTFSYGGVDGDELEKNLATISKHLILKNSTQVIEGELNEKSVSIPMPFYNFKLRKKAINLMSAKFFTDWNDFNMDNRSELKKSLSKRLKIFGSEINSLPRKFRNWAINEKSLVNSLSMPF